MKNTKGVNDNNNIVREGKNLWNMKESVIPTVGCQLGRDSKLP